MSTRPIVKPDSPKQTEIKKEPEIQEPKVEPEIKDNLPVAVEPTFSISPNAKYKATDSSTRRALKTSSTIKSPISSTLVITPKTSVNFSINSTESKTITINISNIGNDVARIRLVQPTCSWCKVVYKGGPIAAGLSVGIDVNVIGQGTPGVFKDCFKIVGESEIFTVPVIANLK